MLRLTGEHTFTDQRSTPEGSFMTELQIGYAAMLEQFAPAEAVALSAYAEEHGFSGVMAADHFQPWVPQQGQSSFVWSVLAAIAERTTGDLGPGVTAPTFRWHPAMVAQASATLAAMYPGRHWLGLGSGEALNEHIVGAYWPEAPERINRMFEAIEIISKLFTGSIAGKDVKHSGQFYKLESTRLWTMPEVAPEILVATAGPVTAKRAGRHADGLITVGAPLEKISMLFGKFDDGARDAGKDPSTMPKVLQLHMSWAETDEEAMKNALLEWPNGGMKFPKGDIRSPFEFEQIAKLVRPEDFEGRMIISADPDEHRKYIQKFVDLGFDRIYLHNVGRNQKQWIDVFGAQVLPKLVR
ncbi:TIGR03557 family F420-dependent LLM class oxidoreductase [Cryobacterium frigoriphilum]|uniref:TIGR03557 family F420-dependent LLM class oxidoreductase n=2 Tax=Cryobacterium frigoriphilum TaxID=1259150 RepID=A0A4R8ZVU7_9MICO|nr:TIGR03557 family F420-dependent LLM class oxidoreductase [Cryobacterium frigoriphilum]